MSGGRPSRVEFEHLGADALGIGSARPRLSWRVPVGDAAGRDPVAHEIRATEGNGAVRTAQRPGAGGLLDPWPFPPLVTGDRREVRIRVRYRGGTESEWSAPSFVEAGLLDADDWRASFVGVPQGGDREALPAIRGRIALDGEVVRARLYATAHGVYDPIVDGHRLDDALLEPGWQSYRHRLRYRTYDITRFATGPVLTVGALLADGWYRGRLGFPLIARDEVYGSALALLAQVELRYADGRISTHGSDRTWQWRPGPILRSSLYDGEHRDTGAEVDWAGADGWRPVVVQGRPEVRLVAPEGPPVRETGTIAPTRIWSSPSGRTLVDFGQNLVGAVRMRASGPAGARISIAHAEVLEDGELGVRPLRTAEAVDSYVLDGGAASVLEPRFSYHGFRYAEVTGWPDGVPGRDDLEAVVQHSDMERTGWFSSSDPLLDRLHENVVWSMRGNFVDIPTDCPQRDERLGWTGDIAVFAPTATYLYGCAGLLESWLADLSAEQKPDGTVPFFVPELPFPPEVRHLPGLDPQPVAVWGDAAVLVPMAMHEESGDTGILQRQYPSMRAWVDRVAQLAGPSRVWDTGFQFGDWLDPAAPPEDPAAGLTDPALVATASFARSADLLARAAGILGRSADAERYAALAAETVSAFRDRFTDPATGVLRRPSQTGYALALCLDLLPAEQRERAGAELVALVRASGHRIGTGFVGTPLVLHALSAVGAHDDAYALLQQRECPSWLFTVLMGGTTLWERWDSMLPDGRINPGEMTSFNHYALGAVADWMHQQIGGLRRTAPGWSSFRVAPRPGGGITHASTAHRGPRGRIAVTWRAEAGRLSVEVEVPAGSTAELDLPGIPIEILDPGTHARSTPLRDAGDAEEHDDAADGRRRPR